MAGRMTILSGVAAMFLVATAGCGLFDPDDTSTGIERYFPLAEGNRWTYLQTLDYGYAETNTVTVRVTSLRGTNGRVSMESSASGHSPAEQHTVTLTADSERVVLANAWFPEAYETLLQEPIARGASWTESYTTSVGSTSFVYTGVATIFTTDTTIVVEGRTYRRVVGVRYAWTAAPDVLNTPTIHRYFAPRVGIVRMDFAYPCLRCGNGTQSLVRHEVR